MILFLKVGSEKMYLVKEYEKQLIETWTKLYPGDVLFNASGAANFNFSVTLDLTEAEPEGMNTALYIRKTVSII